MSFFSTAARGVFRTVRTNVGASAKRRGSTHAKSAEHGTGSWGSSSSRFQTGRATYQMRGGNNGQGGHQYQQQQTKQVVVNKRYSTKATQALENRLVLRAVRPTASLLEQAAEQAVLASFSVEEDDDGTYVYWTDGFFPNTSLPTICAPTNFTFSFPLFGNR